MNTTQGLLLGYLTRPLSPDQLTQEISILGIVATSTGRTVLLCLLVSLLSLSVIKSWLHSDPFGDIPGPFLARHTPFWLAWQARIGRRYLAVDALHQKYGPFVRIAPNHISVSHRDALNVVYGQGTKAFNKSQFYHAFIGNKPSVFSTTDRDDHAQKRRLVSHAFSANSLNSFAPYIHRILVDFVSQMDRVCETGQCIDALMWLNYLAFDILSELAFGEAIGMVSQGSDFVPVEKADGTIGQEHAIALVDEREHLAAVVGIHPVIKTLSKIIPDPFFIRGRKSSTGLIDLARRRVKKRLDSGADRDDLLGRLIGARLANNENGVLSESQVDELVAETVTLLIAGSDTTSNSCIGIIHLVMTHPIVYQKLMEELDDQVGNDSMPDWDRVKNLEYFSAVIREGLRVYATTAIGLHREVPAGGAYCLDRYFPEGTEMSVPAYTIQRDPMIWGDDPDVFRPERWIGRDESELKPYLMTFGRGPRACLGRNLAYIELRMILATIFLRYDITLKSDVLETTEGFMHKPLNMMVNLTRRKSTI